MSNFVVTVTYTIDEETKTITLNMSGKNAERIRLDAIAEVMEMFSGVIIERVVIEPA